MNPNVLPSPMDTQVLQARAQLAQALVHSPLPPDELLRNLGVYLLPMELRRFLLMDFLYRQMLHVPGIIVEFGCRWGQNLATFTSLRAIHEPLNALRTIVAFDTFEGFQGIHPKDGTHPIIAQGSYGVSEGYEAYLDGLLTLKESQSPLAHIKKFRLIPGDAAATFGHYLDEHPETIISLAYFDMDIYEPTLACLKRLTPHLTKGSVVGFDELCFPQFPGETVAFQEAIGSKNVRLQRNHLCHAESFFIYE